MTTILEKQFLKWAVDKNTVIHPGLISSISAPWVSKLWVCITEVMPCLFLFTSLSNHPWTWYQLDISHLYACAAFVYVQQTPFPAVTSKNFWGTVKGKAWDTLQLCGLGAYLCCIRMSCILILINGSAFGWSLCKLMANATHTQQRCRENFLTCLDHQMTPNSCLLRSVLSSISKSCDHVWGAVWSVPSDCPYKGHKIRNWVKPASTWTQKEPSHPSFCSFGICGFRFSKPVQANKSE